MLYHGKQHLPYAAGNKIYGAGRTAPNLGPVDPTGYRERDLKYKARRAAMLRRLKAMKEGAFMSPDVGREI
jgi:hypothetical protein